MSINVRLAKLERKGSTSDVPVWCDTEADVQATIKAMLQDTEISRADIERCRFWPFADARIGQHEAALAELG